MPPGTAPTQQWTGTRPHLAITQVGLLRFLPLTRGHMFAFQPAHGEGWALYAKRLANEPGMLPARTRGSGFSPCRHSERREWSSTSACTLPASFRTAAPGLPKAPFDQRAWLAGRDAARAQQGSSFDLKRWHAAALALGALGLRGLERELATAGSA